MRASYNELRSLGLKIGDLNSRLVFIQSDFNIGKPWALRHKIGQFWILQSDLNIGKHRALRHKSQSILDSTEWS